MSADAKFHVTGLGNAIVDIIARCDDALLAKHNAPKGGMQLVDSATIDTIYADAKPGIEISGGSAANTIAGVASFGGSGAYIAKIADDDFGKIFSHDIKAIGVTYDTAPVSGGLPTSRSLVLVTPDGERTMNTFLGISTAFTPDDIKPHLIADAQILYLEGYLFDDPKAKTAFRAAIQIARDAGRKVSLSLSDSFCVGRHRAEFKELIRDGIDILFANEDEIKALFETATFDAAAAEITKLTDVAALTRSAKGSIIYSGGKSYAIPAAPVADVVDTTGAGDLYAAGVLYGIATGKALETSGKLGALAAAEVIGHLGARPQVSLAELAKTNGII